MSSKPWRKVISKLILYLTVKCGSRLKFCNLTGNIIYLRKLLENMGSIKNDEVNKKDLGSHTGEKWREQDDDEGRSKGVLCKQAWRIISSDWTGGQRGLDGIEMRTCSGVSVTMHKGYL